MGHSMTNIETTELGANVLSETQQTMEQAEA